MHHRFGIKNFRVFRDYTEFELTPITILTGTNGCGKSSLVKALRLLKFNFDNKSQDFLGQLDELNFNDRGNLLGDFNKIVNWDNNSEAIVFSINIIDESSLENPIIYLHYKKQDSSGYGNARLVKVEILDRHDNLSGKKESLLVSYEFSDKWSRTINIEEVYPFLLEAKNQESEQEDHLSKDFLFYYPRLNLLNKIATIDRNGAINYIDKASDIHSDMDSSDALDLIDLFNEFNVNSWIDLKNVIQNFEKDYLRNYELVICPIEVTNPFEDKVESVLHPPKFSLYIKSISSPSHIAFTKSELAQLSITNKLTYFLLDQDKYNSEEINGDPLIMPIRNINPSISKAFLALQNFSLNAVKFGFNSFQKLIDFHFLEAERIKMRRYFFENDDDDFSSLLFEIFRSKEESNSNSTPFIKKRLKYIETWLNNYGIADGFEIISDPDGLALKPFLKNNGKLIPLVDLGFGINQILPIMLKIAITKNKGTVFIEEPESNLHPALQSKLADMLIDAYKKFDIQFVLESHSEYLIRKLQYLVAKKEINPTDISIYYLYQPDKIPEGAKQVEKIELDENGILSQEFGTGFFDEALNWKFELLRLKNQQKN